MFSHDSDKIMTRFQVLNNLQHKQAPGKFQFNSVILEGFSYDYLY